MVCLPPVSMSRFLQPSALAETLCGSPLYMAPEVMQAQKYDAKVRDFFPFLVRLGSSIVNCS
jgi:serine/threonine protein kinase